MRRKMNYEVRKWQWKNVNALEFVMESEDDLALNKKPICPMCGKIAEYHECWYVKRMEWEGYYYECPGCGIRTQTLPHPQE